MVDVVFKDLCVDAQRPEVVGPFWAAVLGLEAEALPDGDQRLRGSRPEQTVWVNRVPEPLAGKNRVHLDVRFADPLQVPGATVVREAGPGQPWRVLADPEGLQWCAFGPHPAHPEAPPGPFELVVDAADPEAAARWWADRTGASVHRREDRDEVWLEGAAGFPWLFWVFAPVPEPKTAKNRVHWDVTLADATVADLVAAGATVLHEQARWTVLADPEGNEFCAFSRPGSAG